MLYRDDLTSRWNVYTQKGSFTISNKSRIVLKYDESDIPVGIYRRYGPCTASFSAETINFRVGYSFRKETGGSNTREITERICSMIRKVMIKRKTPKRRKFLNRTARRSPPRARRFVAPSRYNSFRNYNRETRSRVTFEQSRGKYWMEP